MPRIVRSRRGNVWVWSLRAFGAHGGFQLAASIAYYVVFAFVPVLTLALAAMGLVIRDPRVLQGVVEGVLLNIPLRSGPGDNLITDTLHQVSSRTGTLTLIGVIALFWASSGIFGAIRFSLNKVWETEPGHGMFRQMLSDAGAMLGLGLLLATSVVGTTGLHMLQAGCVQGTFVNGCAPLPLMIAGLAVPAVFSFLVFLLVYRYTPNVDHGLRNVWPAALVATILFESSKHLFAYYVAHFNRYQATYGALGGVMLFMLWTYLSAIVLLFGAELASAKWQLRAIRLATK